MKDGGRRIPARSFNVLAERESGGAQHPAPRRTHRRRSRSAPGRPPKSAYLKIRERESFEYATVSAAVALDLDGDVVRRARIALGSVAMQPWRLEETERRLAGQKLGSPAIEAAVDAGFAEARPLSRNAYKIKLARNAALRTVELAARTA